jgi:hypothetical protein
MFRFDNVRMPAEAAARCSVTFQTYSPIKDGSTGAQAKAMECLLAKAGYATTVNGRFSAADARELAKFRKSIGLNPLAVVGRRAWSALLARGTTPHLEKGDHGKAVVRLELAMRSAGFAKIPTTGRYNAATVAAVPHRQEDLQVRPQKWRPGLLLSRHLTCGALCRQRPGHSRTAPRETGVLHQDEPHAVHGSAPTRLTARGSPRPHVVTGDNGIRPVRVACGHLL